MLSILLIMTFSIMWPIDLPPMLRHKQTGELIAFTILWVAGLSLALLVLFGVKTDYVTEFLRSVFEPIAKTFLKPPPA